MTRPNNGCLKLGIGCLIANVILVICAGIFVALNYDKLKAEVSDGIASLGDMMAVRDKVAEHFQLNNVSIGLNITNGRKEIRVTIENAPFADEVLKAKALEIAKLIRDNLERFDDLEAIRVEFSSSDGSVIKFTDSHRYTFSMDEL